LSGWRPSVNITAEAGRSRIWSESPVRTVAGIPISGGAGGTYTNPKQGTLQVDQPLYTGGRVEAGIKAAENSVLAGRAQLMAIEQDVLFQVVQAYMNVLSGQAVLDLTRKNVQVLQRQLEAAQDRFRVGEITRTDVAQAEARRAEANAQRVTAEGNLQAARANYQRVVGHAPEGLVSPDFAINLPDDLGQAVSLAADENPSVTANTFAALAAEDGVDQQEGELFPQVSLFARAQRLLDQQLEETRSDILTAGVRVTVPLYQAGATYARIREQKHIANQRRIQVHEARRGAVEAATAAWENWQASRASITSLRTQIGAAEVALEGVQREAQVGARTVLDVLDAERELLNARVNLVEAQSNEKIAAFRLMQAVGRLTAPAMGLPAELYDPTEHYMEVRGKWFGTDVELVPEAE
jgi:outer membrane protein